MVGDRILFLWKSENPNRAVEAAPVQASGFPQKK